jgi:hypothetical protein
MAKQPLNGNGEPPSTDRASGELLLLFYIPVTDRWTWRVESEQRAIVAVAKDTFASFFDALANARALGHSCEPRFEHFEGLLPRSSMLARTA